VVSDIVGKTGWAILNALALGETHPEFLAKLAYGSLKGKRTELASALRGFVTPHFCWLLRELLDDVARLDRKLTELEGSARRDPAVVHDSWSQRNNGMDDPGGTRHKYGAVS
jgi:hypothetical protein